MKTFKNKWLMLSNRVLSIMMALFGITACDDNFTCAYGSPYGTFEVTGTVTDENGQNIKDENIIIQRPYSPTDTVKTAADGSYTYKEEGPFFGSQEIVIIANDPTDTYENDTVKVVPQKVKEGDGKWFDGTYSNNVNFKLKKKTK